MKNALQLSHEILDHLILQFPQGNFVDATLGKGNDALFIVSHPKFNGHLYGFDIQQKAIQISKESLSGYPETTYQLFHTGHERFDTVLNKQVLPILHGAIFNLGYLPGANHQITTQASSTVDAVSQMANRLSSMGKIILVVYSGHPAGAIEKQELLTQLSHWPQDKFAISIIDFINQKNNPPALIIIEKK